MKKFKLVRLYNNPEKFEDLVNKALREGWEFSGPLFFRGETLYQPMVKDDNYDSYKV